MSWTLAEDDTLWGLHLRRVSLWVQALVLGRDEEMVARRMKKLRLEELAKRIRAQRGRRKAA